MSGSPWLVYIVESARGALYTGVTTSLERRLREHAGGARGARFFRVAGPATVRYVEPAADRASAQRREAAIKRLPRRAKLALIEGAPADGANAAAADRAAGAARTPAGTVAR